MTTAAAIFLLFGSFCLLASCVMPVKPQPPHVCPPQIEDVKLAEVVVSSRNKRGQFDTPDVSPFGGAPVVAKRWQFIDANGRSFFGETLKVKPLEVK